MCVLHRTIAWPLKHFNTLRLKVLEALGRVAIVAIRYGSTTVQILDDCDCRQLAKLKLYCVREPGGDGDPVVCIPLPVIMARTRFPYEKNESRALWFIIRDLPDVEIRDGRGRLIARIERISGYKALTHMNALVGGIVG